MRLSAERSLARKIASTSVTTSIGSLVASRRRELTLLTSVMANLFALVAMLGWKATVFGQLDLADCDHCADAKLLAQHCFAEAKNWLETP